MSAPLRRLAWPAVAVAVFAAAFAWALVRGREREAATAAPAERAAPAAEAASRRASPRAEPGPRSAAATAESSSPLALRVRVLSERPRRSDAFTQGLVWHEGRLYESTGGYGGSSLRRVDPESGEVERRVDLPARYFGEGLARVGGELFQLTWRERTAFVWSLETFERVGSRGYAGEGWGLCHAPPHLVMSDGGDRLAFLDPADFAVARTVAVTLEGRPLAGLNELECAEGWVYANVFETETIVRIDPQSGEVVATIDASGLLDPATRRAEQVLNGIAYDERRETFYLTGKLWPKLFEVIFVQR